MNEMKLVFKSKLVNEVFVRTSVVAFLAPLHLGMEMLMEIKTIVAEARQRLCAAVTQSTPNVAENERSRLTSTAAYGFCRHKSSAARPSEVSASLFLLNRAPP